VAKGRKTGKQVVAQADPAAVECRGEARWPRDRKPKGQRLGPTEVYPPCPFWSGPALGLAGTADGPLFVRRLIRPDSVADPLFAPRCGVMLTRLADKAQPEAQAREKVLAGEQHHASLRSFQGDRRDSVGATASPRLRFGLRLPS
jgi:hypothetical protein